MVMRLVKWQTQAALIGGGVDRGSGSRQGDLRMIVAREREWFAPLLALLGGAPSILVGFR